MHKKLFLVVILCAFAEGSLLSSELMAQGPTTPVAPPPSTPAEPTTPTSPCANACKELVDHFKLTVAAKYNVLCGDFKSHIPRMCKKKQIICVFPKTIVTARPNFQKKCKF